MQKTKGGNLLVVHGGGPTAVINASLQGVLLEARKHDEIKEVWGARRGVEGLLKEEFADLGRLPQHSVELLPEVEQVTLEEMASRYKKAGI